MTREKIFTVLTITQVLGAVISLFVGIALARVLSKADLGIYREVLFVFSFVVPFTLLELPTAVLYFLPRFKGEERGLYIELTYIFSIIVGALFILLFFFLSPVFEHYGTKVGGTASLFILISFAAPFAFIVTFFRQILITIRELKTLFYFGIILGFLSILPIMTVLLFADSPEMLKFVIFAVVVQYIIGAMIAIYWFFKRRLKQHNMIGFNMYKFVNFVQRNWREQFKYSIYLVARLPMVLLAKDFDRLIIMGFLSASSFAVYTIGAVRIPFLPTLRTSLVNTLVPEVAEKYHEIGKVSKETLHAWRRGIQLTALIIIPAFVFLEIFSHEFIVSLYTIKYAESVAIFRAYLFLVPSYLLSFGIFLQGTGHTKPIFISSIIFLIINVVLSLVLLKFLGLVGPAIGTVVANFIGVGYVWNESWKVIGEEPFGAVVRNDLLRILAESLAAGIIIKSILLFTCADLNYLIQLAIGFAGSGGLLLIIWCFCRRSTIAEVWTLARGMVRTERRN